MMQTAKTKTMKITVRRLEKIESTSVPVRCPSCG